VLLFLWDRNRGIQAPVLGLCKGPRLLYMQDHPSVPKKSAKLLVRRERGKEKDPAAVDFRFPHREYFPPFLK